MWSCDRQSKCLHSSSSCCPPPPGEKDTGRSRLCRIRENNVMSVTHLNRETKSQTGVMTSMQNECRMYKRWLKPFSGLSWQYTPHDRPCSPLTASLMESSRCVCVCVCVCVPCVSAPPTGSSVSAHRNNNNDASASDANLALLLLDLATFQTTLATYFSKST